jgi:hypothetical protein
MAMTRSLNRVKTARQLSRDDKNELRLEQLHTLFQEVFFFCTVKNIGDVRGPGCIYVETVVDRDTGMAFAKVYCARNPNNAVDILKSRVFPFFKRRGLAIGEIHTRHTNEYCGLPTIHPFETYLAASDVLHVTKIKPGHPENRLCEQFYRLLLKDFFMPALRKKFQIFLDGLQTDLDAFVETYNTSLEQREKTTGIESYPAMDLTVHL